MTSPSATNDPVEEIKEFHFHLYWLTQSKQARANVETLLAKINTKNDRGYFVAKPLHINEGPVGRPTDVTIMIHPLSKHQLLDHTERVAFMGDAVPLFVESLQPPILKEAPAQYPQLGVSCVSPESEKEIRMSTASITLTASSPPPTEVPITSGGLDSTTTAADSLQPAAEPVDSSSFDPVLDATPLEQVPAPATMAIDAAVVAELSSETEAAAFVALPADPVTSGIDDASTLPPQPLANDNPSKAAFQDTLPLSSTTLAPTPLPAPQDPITRHASTSEITTASVSTTSGISLVAAKTGGQDPSIGVQESARAANTKAVGTIAGIIAACLIAIAVVGVLVVKLRKQRKNRNTAGSNFFAGSIAKRDVEHGGSSEFQSYMPDYVRGENKAPGYHLAGKRRVTIVLPTPFTSQRPFTLFTDDGDSVMDLRDPRYSEFYASTIKSAGEGKDSDDADTIKHSSVDFEHI
ncbi:hypothetical protein HDU98_006908 [Podochytrium sp. JEL0797]|nr:hypothetical protein HDU98_006908 [Podochytrium sp. JEL0797]